MPKKSTDEQALAVRQQALLREYSPVVQQIAGGILRHLPSHVLREDVVAAGMGGLWDGIYRSGDRPITETFEWYIRVRIRGAILDELRRTDWLSRRNRADLIAAADDDKTVRPRAVIRFDELSESERKQILQTSADAEDTAIAEERLATVLSLIDKMPERDRYIVTQLYFHRKKMRELGAEFGVSEPRISQVHARVIRKLRKLIPGSLPPGKPKRKK